MGYSERTGSIRRLADRIVDLGTIVDALDISTPIVALAHDWGGPITLGWAVGHVDRLEAVVLTNTAIHQPENSSAPTVIRAARLSGLLNSVTVRTPTFIRSTTGLSRTNHTMSKATAAAFAAPYKTAKDRVAIGDFVADIPLEADHPSRAVLDVIAEGLGALKDVPILMLWGPGDPVFSDRYLVDLHERLPHASIHRYEGARHLVFEDAPHAIDDMWEWLSTVDAAKQTKRSRHGRVKKSTFMVDGLYKRRDDESVALAELSNGRKVSWRLLATRVDEIAAGLAVLGVKKGDRVATLVRPGADLVAVVYACWRLGAVVVIADAGLGVAGMRRALRGAHPDHVIAIAQGLLLSRTLSIPGLRILVGGGSSAGLKSDTSLSGVAALGRGMSLPAGPAGDDLALVAFTSGSTGPAKGVRYTHRQLGRLRDALTAHFSIKATDSLVAAFAPWAVLGPALGIASSVPDMDVTAPRTLTARALADATGAVSGTLVWAAPAALRNVVATAGELSPESAVTLDSVRLLMVAGAPVSPELLGAGLRLMRKAEGRTPYGMTEVLPVTDVTYAQLAAEDSTDGVLVGVPLKDVEVSISALGEDGIACGPLSADPGVTGEIVVSAPWMSAGYDALWATTTHARRDDGWHRTGDVGHLDSEGRLWVEGRLAHVAVTADGPVTPVPVERRVEAATGCRSACVGVGPRGAQVLAVIIESNVRKWRLADVSLSAHVRSACPQVDIAAVIEVPALPVDIRHNSKIDRAAVAAWAEQVLSGQRAGDLV